MEKSNKKTDYFESISGLRTLSKTTSSNSSPQTHTMTQCDVTMHTAPQFDRNATAVAPKNTHAHSHSFTHTHRHRHRSSARLATQPSSSQLPILTHQALHVQFSSPVSIALRCICMHVWCSCSCVCCTCGGFTSFLFRQRTTSECGQHDTCGEHSKHPISQRIHMPQPCVELDRKPYTCHQCLLRALGLTQMLDKLCVRHIYIKQNQFVVQTAAKQNPLLSCSCCCGTVQINFVFFLVQLQSFQKCFCTVAKLFSGSKLRQQKNGTMSEVVDIDLIISKLLEGGCWFHDSCVTSEGRKKK